MTPKTKKIATNLPKDLILEATRVTGLNQTQTLIEGLREIIRKHKRERLLKLKGKVKINLNLSKLRERHLL